VDTSFIHKDAPVLWIVLKLHHVKRAVISFHEVCLGASAHLADVPAGGERHLK
jgi:hypothetical protein